jgi:peptidoglycan lytic transglycosylase G
MTFLGLRLPVALLFFLGFPVFWLIWIGTYALSPGPSMPQQQIEVVIPARTSLTAIAEILVENKVIRGETRFTMLALLTGSGNKLKAGEYVFETGKRPLSVIDRLKKGEVLYRPVTIPEGTDMVTIAQILAAEGWVDSQRFLDLVHDPEILEDYGIQADSLEGYLFPDTYYLSKGQQSTAEIIRMMVRRHFQVYDELTKNSSRIPEIQLTHHKIVTLASIVEKETGLEEERGLVASVYLNRLAKGMRLQADPTVGYGLKKNPGELSRDDLESPSVYNTYKITGLPPGPISNPGRASLKAVLFPVASDYLYFVAKDDKSHYFSRTLQEHNKAVTKYRNGK